MTQVKYLILGGGIAGTTAAETIRQNDPEGKIVIIVDEPYRLYSRISLMNYLKGGAPKENLILRKPEFYSEKNIELMSGVKAESLNIEQKTIKLSNQEEIQYEKLLLATGARARIHPLSAKCSDGIYNFWTIDDTEKIVNKIKNSKSAVVVGGGFVGLELAVSFAERKLETHYLIREPYFWPAALDQKGAELIQKILTANGVTIYTNEEIADIEVDNSLKAVITKSGKRIPADILGIGIGTVPNIELTKNTTIKTNHGIVTNEFMETNVADVWSAGDVAEFYDIIAQKNTILGNWAFSREQGRIVGLGMCGKKTLFKQVPCNSLSFFKCYIGFIGSVMVNPETKIISRELNINQNTGYVRIFINNGKISGASIINHLPSCLPLTKLIQSEVNIEKYYDKLADVSVDLAKLAEEILTHSE